MASMGDQISNQISKGETVFVELMPLLGERTVMITVARLNQNSVRVNVIPSRKKKEDENAALATPLSFSGTPEELDRELGSSLASYVEDNLRLQTALVEAKAEMEAAAKAAREQAKAKTVQSTRKQEDSAAKETTSDPAPADQNMTLFATQQK
jgi:PRTRC genetic system protein E